MVDIQVYFFGASWCGPCKTTKAILQEKDVADLLKRYNNYYIDIDEHPEWKEFYKIRQIPTILIVKVDGKDRTVLYKWNSNDKEELKKRLRQYLRSPVLSRPLLQAIKKPVLFLQNSLDKTPK